MGDKRTVDRIIEDFLFFVEISLLIFNLFLFCKLLFFEFIEYHPAKEKKQQQQNGTETDI